MNNSRFHKSQNHTQHPFDAADIGHTVLSYLSVKELHKAARTSKIFSSYISEPSAVRTRLENLLGTDLKSLGIELKDDDLNTSRLLNKRVIWEACFTILTHENSSLEQRQEVAAIIIAFKNAPIIVDWLRLCIVFSKNEDDGESIALMLLNGLPNNLLMNDLQPRPVEYKSDYDSYYDETIVTAAIKKKYFQLVEAFSHRSDVDFSKPNRWGETAFLLAIQMPHCYRYGNYDYHDDYDYHRYAGKYIYTHFEIKLNVIKALLGHPTTKTYLASKDNDALRHCLGCLDGQIYIREFSGNTTLCRVSCKDRFYTCIILELL